MDQFGRPEELGMNESKIYLFIAQISTLFFVILASLINLSLNIGDQKLWITLLSMSLGCILPTPKMNSKPINYLQRDNSTHIKPTLESVVS